MFEQFFLSVQQDIKLFLFFPILCAVFRLIFIIIHKPYSSLSGKGKALFQCFRFGFWWGMDINAYVFLWSLVLVTLPSLFVPTLASISDTLRITIGVIYAIVLYIAFMGKMIFYSQFHDIFNNIIFLGQKAEKHNLLDVFFNQYHGIQKLFLSIPYVLIIYFCIKNILALSSLPYPELSGISSYVFNILTVLFLTVLFYYCRYGGTFLHDNKPEWDTIPAVVKADPFLAKATVDDLIALKILRHHPMNETMQMSDTENLAIAKPLIEKLGGNTQNIENILKAFQHKAHGALIDMPSHIFLIVGESYSQPYFDPAFSDLHIADEGKKLMADPHTASISTTLSAGIISRPSIVSLMLGIFDAGLELNEREAFWNGTLPTSLPLQLRKLGYDTNYWYGGSLANGNFSHFAPACGFDHAYSATEFCGPNAPKSWVGVYDHIFLQKAAELICQNRKKLQFHFIYTTSNHGPYKMPLKKLGFDAEKIMNVQSDVLQEKIIPKVLGAYWYSDRAINNFIKDMKAKFPDSLFIVTGDHGAQCSELQHTSFMNREYTFREFHSPILMFHHHQINADTLAGNRIGGHMNIIPTIFELIAPKDFTYYSMFSSLTTPIKYCVTPYHWVTTNAIGACKESYYQLLSAKSGAEQLQGKAPYDDICAAEKSLTAYLLQHPEYLHPADKWLQ